MRIIVNYKPTKEKVEEYQVIQILNNSDIFIELPIAVADFGVIYDKPVIFGDINGIPYIREAKEVEAHIKDMPLHYFRIDNERLIPVEKGNEDIAVRLPKGTNTEQLIYDNGQIVWAKPIEEKEDEADGNS